MATVAPTSDTSAPSRPRSPAAPAPAASPVHTPARAAAPTASDSRSVSREARETSPSGQQPGPNRQTLAQNFGGGQAPDPASAAAPGARYVGPGNVQDFDHFTRREDDGPAQPDNPLHGEVTAALARQRAPGAHVVQVPGSDGMTASSIPDMRPEEGALTRQQNEATTSPDPALARFDHDCVGKQLATLNTSSAELEQERGLGVHDGATNLSMGASRADSLADEWRDHVSPAFRPVEDPAHPFQSAEQRAGAQQQHDDALQTVRDYAHSFNLDPQKLLSSNSSVSGPARLALQQRLAAEQDRALASNGNLGVAQNRFDQAVQGLAANHQSVVVANGNSGEYLRDLQRDAGGRALTNVGPDFGRNVLSQAPGTVSVGADASGVRGEQRNWRGNAPGTTPTLYADGRDNAGHSQPGAPLGTSFAAPRVSAELAQIHGEQPGISNAEALRQLFQRRTTLRDSGQPGHPLRVLNGPLAR